jgi:hypothetical protein
MEAQTKPFDVRAAPALITLRHYFLALPPLHPSIRLEPCKF